MSCVRCGLGHSTSERPTAPPVRRRSARRGVRTHLSEGLVGPNASRAVLSAAAQVTWCVGLARPAQPGPPGADWQSRAAGWVRHTTDSTHGRPVAPNVLARVPVHPCVRVAFILRNRRKAVAPPRARTTLVCSPCSGLSGLSGGRARPVRAPRRRVGRAADLRTAGPGGAGSWRWGDVRARCRSGAPLCDRRLPDLAALTFSACRLPALRQGRDRRR